MFTITTLFSDGSQGKMEHMSWDDVSITLRVIHDHLTGVTLRRMDIVSEEI